MKYRMLGSSGVAVTTFALGTMTFGAEADEETSAGLLDHYTGAGGNFIDTADVYTSGAAEEIIGRWIKRNPGRRNDLVLATKARLPVGPGPNSLGLSRKHLRNALDGSLRRLGVEHIDLYQLHAWDALTPIEESLRFLDDAIAAGKIGYFGFSNFLGWQVTKASWTARSCSFSLPVTLQPQYSLLARDIEHEIAPAAADAGIGLLPWSPLAGGWLSGKYAKDRVPEHESRLGLIASRGSDAFSKRNSQNTTWEIISEVQRIADLRHVTLAQVALAWVAAQHNVTSVILGARNQTQLSENLGAAELSLDRTELDALDAISLPRMPEYPYGESAIRQRSRRIEGGR